MKSTASGKCSKMDILRLFSTRQARFLPKDCREMEYAQILSRECGCRPTGLIHKTLLKQ